MDTPLDRRLAIDSARLWQSLMSLAELGATPKGGVCRLALTDLDRQARERVIGWARALDCTVRIDAIGNVFMRRAGRRSDLPAVATGSHIDTQPNGGKFDGNYGVLAGIEVLRTLEQHGVATEAPLEVCIWTNEEGSRFVPVMMGSGVYAGAFTLEHALSAKDREGTSVREALAAIGHAGPSPAAVADGAPGFGAYFEAHIEQGPVLEHEKTTIGVVTGALGQRWYDVTITGMEAHAGPTPMALRRDAMQGAAEIMQAVVAIAGRQGPDGRGTVGWIDVFPNSRNVIPGRVRFTVDFRHATDAALLAMDAELRATVAAVAERRQLESSVEQVVYFPPAAFDERLVNAVRNGAKHAGQSHLDIVSGAGHDAVYVARTAPTAMIFVPCADGISHNEIESAEPEHLAAGCNVLLHSMLEAAGVAS